ncbi:MAG TPA: GNAT family N-acetyltransferase [Polyangiaceae bacterium]
MSTLIRPAGAADLPALGQLAGALVRFHHALNPRRYMLAPGVEEGYARWFESELENPRAVILTASKHDTLVGYAYGRVEDRDWNALLDRHGAVHDLFVDASARRSGVGRKLLSAVLRALHDKGAPRVLLNTAIENSGAQALFAAFGFRTTMLEMTREAESAADQ